MYYESLMEAEKVMPCRLARQGLYVHKYELLSNPVKSVHVVTVLNHMSSLESQQ